MKNAKSITKIPKKILVIDDDDAILEVIQTLLEDEGHIVETASNGKEILSRTNYFPDLILLDMLLSGEDGSKICLKLKAKQETKQIPVVVLSAHSNIEQTAKNCHADNYLPKPFDIDVLMAVVRKYLR